MCIYKGVASLPVPALIFRKIRGRSRTICASLISTNFAGPFDGALLGCCVPCRSYREYTRARARDASESAATRDKEDAAAHVCTFNYSMEPRSVLVTHSTNANHEIFGVSGILLGSDWVLTHGSLFEPNFYEAASHQVRDFLYNVQEQLEKDLVALPDTIAKSFKFQIYYNTTMDMNEQHVTVTANGKNVVEKSCSLRVVWRCPLLRRTFNNLLFSWSFNRAGKFDKSLLPIFLLLRVENNGYTGANISAEARKVLSDFYAGHLERLESRPRRGHPVEIEAAPFGSVAFLSTLSRGIVSNVLGEADCLVLTDASAVPGCEGAPLFALESKEQRVQRRRICGLVVAPLSWCSGERVDYTFAANLRACLRNVRAGPDKGPECRGLTSSSPASSSPLLDLLDKSLVVVKSGSSWGTGIVVDAPAGVIITCSHVLREVPGDHVKVRLMDHIEAWARLIYRTRDGQPYDVAVLKLQQQYQGLKSLPIASQAPAEAGAPVMTAGFSFWQSSVASCSRGYVSRQTNCMLQTSCCVQSGSSGGPVLDCDGPLGPRVLGLVVSNVAASSGGSTGGLDCLYPRFNMAVPATVLCRPLAEYTRTGDVKCLESFSSNDPVVRETWNLYLTPRSKM